MNPESLSSLGERAYDYLYRLVTEVGPRPAGSASERRAQDWLGEDLHAWGYTLAYQKVPFAPQPAYFPFYLLPAVAFPLAAWGLAAFPWLALLLPLGVMALPELAFTLQGCLPTRAESCNLLACPAGTDVVNLDLLFCAHVDTAPAVPYSGEAWYQWRVQIFPVMQRLAWILALVGLWTLCGLPLPAPVYWAAGTLATLLGAALLVQDVWEQRGARTNGFTPGANDNASGVGVLMALAEHLAAHSPSTLKVGFVFTGAEECGLLGAQVCAQQLSRTGAQPRVVNLDMVAAGERLNVITRAGRLFPRRTDRTLNTWLHRADPQAGELAYTLRSGDFVPFVRLGFPAASLEGSGTPRSWRAYHTAQDGLAVIDPAALERCTTALIQLIWLLERDQASAPHS